MSLIINNQRDEQEPEKEIVKKQSEKGTWFQKPSEQYFCGRENDQPCKLLLVDHDGGLRIDIEGHC